MERYYDHTTKKYEDLFVADWVHPEGCSQLLKINLNYVKAKGQFTAFKTCISDWGIHWVWISKSDRRFIWIWSQTIGVFFEKEVDEKRTASTGWYNSAAFEKFAHREGYYAKSINGDAFSQQIKEPYRCFDSYRIVSKVDLIVYSLASITTYASCHLDKVFSSALKPIGRSFAGKSIDAFRGEVKDVVIAPATDDEMA